MISKREPKHMSWASFFAHLIVIIATISFAVYILNAIQNAANKYDQQQHAK